MHTHLRHGLWALNNLLLLAAGYMCVLGPAQKTGFAMGASGIAHCRLSMRVHTCWLVLCAGKYSGGDVPAGSRFSLEQYKGLADKKLKEKQAQLEAVDKLAPIAKELDCTLAQVGDNPQLVHSRRKRLTASPLQASCFWQPIMNTASPGLPT